MIRMFDYQRGLAPIRADLHDRLDQVLDSGRLILGPQTEQFETEFAEWLGVEHCVAVTSGTAALFLAVKALGIGPGDEVITVANTCPPTVAAIRLTGARVRFVDVNPESLMMCPVEVEGAIGRQTRAILPVHLWGSAAPVKRLQAIAEEHGLDLIEDCAQSAGTLIDNQKAGTFGRLGCFSFYPSKNLGAYGDGGAVVTDDADLADSLRRLRMYGYAGSPVATIEGANARINELQAAFLRVKLPSLDVENERRRANASVYLAALADGNTPRIPDNVSHCYHQFVIRCEDRAAMTKALDAAGIQWGIHYENPVHEMPAYRQFHRSLPVTEQACANILSIPVHEHLRDDEVLTIARAISS